MSGIQTSKIWRVVAVWALASFAAILLSGCGQTAGETVSVHVKVTATDRTVVDDTVTVDAEQTADQAIIAACQKEKKAYTFQNGMFDGFDGVLSTQTDGWLLYVNDTLADVGAKDVRLSDGDAVEFRYVNYDEAFASS